MCEAIAQLSRQLLEQLFYWVESWTAASLRTIIGPIIIQDFDLVTATWLIICRMLQIIGPIAIILTNHRRVFKKLRI